MNALITTVAITYFVIFKYLNKFHGDTSFRRFKEVTLSRELILNLHESNINPDLLEDKEINSQVYTELEIQKHAIMLDNLPKDVPCKVMETKVRSLFEEILKS